MKIKPESLKPEELLLHFEELLLIVQEYGEMQFSLIDALKRVQGTEHLRVGLYELMDRRRAVEAKLKGPRMKDSRRMRDAQSAKVLLEEVHIANMVDKYTEINLRNRKVAAVPEVGIFWVDIQAKKVYAEKTRLPDADDMGGFKIHLRGHYEAWGAISKQNPKWRGVEYEDIPRGRVIYVKDPHNPKFIVYTNKQVKGKTALQNAIASEFNLPSGHYEFDFTDEHYEI
jgi:hypothetical protein